MIRVPVFHDRIAIGHSRCKCRQDGITFNVPLANAPGNPLLDIYVLLKRLEITKQPVDAVQSVPGVKLAFPVVISCFL